MGTSKDNSEAKLSQRIAALRPGQAPVTTTLKTSGRVLRRVTDGIYREPWAAIRELISNAYDADATEVEITTDAPWFRSIVVRDNGNGFTRDSLASALENIGGSPKRTSDGAHLGVTSSKDPTRSPGGRRLIGKLGIGLFAVSHLTQRFRIITKAATEKYRTIADVILIKYSEDEEHPTGDDELRTTGQASIYCVPADDVDSQGTDIIIEDILPKTRSEFQSSDHWNFLRTTREENELRDPPVVHIGHPAKDGSDTFEVPPAVPWKNTDTPLERFKALAAAMFMRADQPGAGRKPSLATTFDNYFRFVWLLSLGAPLDYIDIHPFDLDSTAGIRFFKLGRFGEQAKEIELAKGESLRQHLGLRAPERGRTKTFRVFIDGLDLRRPIRFRGLRGSESVDKPLLFVGTDKPDLSKYDPNRTGGPLQFEGYLLWSQRVVPFDHVGALVRVGDSSGSLFDSTFMGYPVSEQNRKEQVTCEVFALQGLDAALNIDRESFNKSHPHHQYVARWVHDSFRQFANQHKELGKSRREASLVTQLASSSKQLANVVKQIVHARTEGEPPVKVELVEGGKKLFDTKGDAIVLSKENVQNVLLTGERVTKPSAARFIQRELKLKGVMQVLYAAKLLDDLDHYEVEALAIDLARVMFFEDEL